MKRSITGAVLCCAIFISGCADKKGNSDKKKEIPVKVRSIKTTSINAQQNYVGTVEELFSSTLSFEVVGNVSRINAGEGQIVHKGQLLACLNKVTLQNNYDAALSTLKQAEDAYNRMKVLYENNSLPEVKWVEVQTSLQQAKSLESIAKKTLNDCCLYAPFSGVITARNIESGTNVMPGMPAFKLAAIDKVKIKFAIPEKEIGKTQIGQTANIIIAALEDRQMKGRISEKNVIANPLSHTYEVKVILDNPKSDLMPGMVCNVNMEQEEHVEKIIVPANVVQVAHTGETFVWLAVNNQAIRRIVKTSGFSNNDVVVSHGLAEGEQIIIEGTQKVSEGMKIIIR